MSRKFFLFFPLLFLSFSLAFGNDDPERFLKENKLEGSFFLKEIATGREYVVNPEDVDLPTLPASTFKIVNSLIGIETGVVKDPSDLFPWDGHRVRGRRLRHGGRAAAPEAGRDLGGHGRAVGQAGDDAHVNIVERKPRVGEWTAQTDLHDKSPLVASPATLRRAGWIMHRSIDPPQSEQTWSHRRRSDDPS